MGGSSFGTLFRLTTFGESHGVAMGGVIDGAPAGLEVDFGAVQLDLDRRKPGQSAIVTQRKEEDKVEFLSGIFEGKTTGSPIGFIIRNSDQKSADYEHLRDTYRPSHADFTWDRKFGIRDHRGGGRSSARETISRVVAGALAKQYLAKLGVEIDAWVDQVGGVKWMGEWKNELRNVRDSNPVYAPDAAVAEEMESLIREVRKDGDTVGGCISCRISGLPAGLGEPVFDKFHAELGKAMLSINAVKGFEFGSGFNAIEMRGSQHNDIFLQGGQTQTNHSGGVQGGITNGMPVNFRVAFKPVATIVPEQQTIDSSLKQTTVSGKGRHDACVVPRAVVIVEAMAALVAMDFWLRNKTSR